MQDSDALVTWLSRCSVQIDVTLTRGKHAVLMLRRVDLLAEIDRTQSISAAARNLGISYRHAWLMVQDANTTAGKTLVESAVGGKSGGGARLTEYGRRALGLFNELQTVIRAAAAQALPRALGTPLDQRPFVRLLAAVSLQDAVGQLLADFTLLRPDIQVRTIFGSSNELAEHVLGGSPADLFVSANDACLDQLDAQGWIVAGKRRKIGGNGLALVGATKDEQPLPTLADLPALQNASLALADPSSPLGTYTRAWLEQAGVTLSGDSTILADNSRGVVSILNSHRARLGIVFTSDVSRLPEHRVIATCAAQQLSMAYVAAVLNRGTSQKDAEALLVFLLSADGQSRLRHCGIERAETGKPAKSAHRRRTTPTKK